MLEGISLKQAYHFAQIALNDHFRQFDYDNIFTNIQIYGSPEPPAYNISTISCPSYVYYGTHDAFVPVKGARKFFKRLGNVKEVTELPWSHNELLYAKNIDLLVNYPIIRSMLTDSETFNSRNYVFSNYYK